MKTLMFVLFLLCASVAWGQSMIGTGALSNEPQKIEFRSHPQHASQTGMAIEHRVLEQSSYVAAKGELPLWEVAELPASVPLGDIARALRQGKGLEKRAERVWSN